LLDVIRNIHFPASGAVVLTAIAKQVRVATAKMQVGFTRRWQRTWSNLSTATEPEELLLVASRRS
jgi:hypothetical protein